ncbi:hypothetical protein DFH11DRAFT_362259 [Phellopilus nigrolimitatus]|nr:hypothetical protein DFH11DRAFT_362259 [Phellopilus nigrolimitatus]
MPRWENFDAWVTSDGERFEEYDIKVVGNVVTCYVASEVDKIFQVQWRNYEEPWFISNAVRVAVDGAQLDSTACRHELGVRWSESKGHWMNATSYRPYKFSAVTFTDDETVATSSSKDLGVITVTISRVILSAARGFFISEKLPENLGMPLNERAKKMGSHKVNLDDVAKEGEVSRGTATATLYPGIIDPFVTFHFKYRSKDILRALEIIPVIRTEGNKRPRSTSPVPGSSGEKEQRGKRRASNVKLENDVIDLSDDDDAELMAQQAEIVKQQADLARKLEALRNRRRNAGSTVKKEVKTESDANGSTNRTGFVVDENGAIDLTLD